LTTGCGLLYYGLSTTGKQTPQGTVVDCGAFTFKVPESSYRVTPNRYGPNSLMAYQDFGPGSPRGGLFTVSETDGFQSDRFGEEMQRIEKSHINFWDEATSVQGAFRKGEVFSGILPEVARKMGNNKMIQRPAIGFVGQVKTIGTKKYLLFYMDSLDDLRGDYGNWRSHRIKLYHQFAREVRPK
jgi:hypothetical protein